VGVGKAENSLVVERVDVLGPAGIVDIVCGGVTERVEERLEGRVVVVDAVVGNGLVATAAMVAGVVAGARVGLVAKGLKELVKVVA
jgi:tRNA-binding EMAP/Myf-like protein